jgi:hypothetical protein
MNATTLSPTDFDKPVSRTAVMTLINTALRLKEYRFARQVTLAWLATFPGDLGINLAHAQALLGEGKYSQVAPIIEDLCQKDPEFLPAQRIRAMVEVTKDPTLRAQALAAIQSMTGQTKDGMRTPDWAALTWQSRQALQTGNTAKASELIHQALGADPASPVPAILHLQLTLKTEDQAAARSLAQVYGTRWSECLQFKLYLAEALMTLGDEPAAVALLHQCAANDAAGQVTARIWGNTHPYKPLWPSSLEILFDLPVPAAVSGALGWNQLVGGAPASQPAATTTAVQGKSAPKADPSEPISPDILRSIQTEFDRLARRLRLPNLSRSDARYPILVVFSTRTGLENLYGPQTAAAVITEMNNLVSVVKKRAGWGAISFLADDPISVSPFEVKPAPANDAWKLKLTLHDLDAALGKKGAMVGALLIVGGPEVVPFHKLPNPTDDADPEILSDNPYASLDENYFVPDWSCGRLPGGSTNDAGLLLSALRRTVDYHKKQTTSSTIFTSFFRAFFRNVKKALPRGPKNRPMKPSGGYSAAIWKQSSLAAYKPIGEQQTFATCPPTQAGGLLEANIFPSRLSYFNLHGLQDGPDWYGQRDPATQPGIPDYPTAITTKDILNSNQASQFVFSEACYGGYIDKKTEDQSIALKFVSCGCQAMVASTCVSYGSVTTPLIAADLLGYHYWKQLQDGKSAGEALQQAKINLVNEMNKRQGYLDGEDQKTLISFVLYGDPLATLAESGARTKTTVRPHEHPAVRVISDARGEDLAAEPVPAELLENVKGLLDQYLPGLRETDFAMAHQKSMFNEEGHPMPGSQMGAKVKASQAPNHRVVTVSKQVEFARHVHHHYARVTLDAKGKVVKFVVSR